MGIQEVIPEGTKPYFMKLPPNIINVKEGDPIFVNCIIDGDPKPAVTWLKGARELSYTQRMRVMVNADHYTLNMSAALQTDPGQYTCVATNRCGSVQTNVWINVLPRGKEEPEDWELTMYKTEQSDAYVEKTRTTKSENVAPKFLIKLPRETEIIEGDDLVIDCNVNEGEPKTSIQTEFRIKESGGIKVKEEKVRISTKIGDEDPTVLESKVILDTNKFASDKKISEEVKESSYNDDKEQIKREELERSEKSEIISNYEETILDEELQGISYDDKQQIEMEELERAEMMSLAEEKLKQKKLAEEVIEITSMEPSSEPTEKIKDEPVEPLVSVPMEEKSLELIPSAEKVVEEEIPSTEVQPVEKSTEQLEVQLTETVKIVSIDEKQMESPPSIEKQVECKPEEQSILPTEQIQEELIPVEEKKVEEIITTEKQVEEVTPLPDKPLDEIKVEEVISLPKKQIEETIPSTEEILEIKPVEEILEIKPVEETLEIKPVAPTQGEQIKDEIVETAPIEEKPTDVIPSNDTCHVEEEIKQIVDEIDHTKDESAQPALVPEEIAGTEEPSVPEIIDGVETQLEVSTPVLDLPNEDVDILSNKVDINQDIISEDSIMVELVQDAKQHRPQVSDIKAEREDSIEVVTLLADSIPEIEREAILEELIVNDQSNVDNNLEEVQIISTIQETQSQEKSSENFIVCDTDNTIYVKEEITLVQDQDISIEIIKSNDVNNSSAPIVEEQYLSNVPAENIIIENNVIDVQSTVPVDEPSAFKEIVVSSDIAQESKENFCEINVTSPQNISISATIETVYPPSEFPEVHQSPKLIGNIDENVSISQSKIKSCYETISTILENRNGQCIKRIKTITKKVDEQGTATESEKLNEEIIDINAEEIPIVPIEMIKTIGTHITRTIENIDGKWVEMIKKNVRTMDEQGNITDEIFNEQIDCEPPCSNNLINEMPISEHTTKLGNESDKMEKDQVKVKMVSRNIKIHREILNQDGGWIEKTLTTTTDIDENGVENISSDTNIKKLENDSQELGSRVNDTSKRVLIETIVAHKEDKWVETTITTTTETDENGEVSSKKDIVEKNIEGPPEQLLNLGQIAGSKHVNVQRSASLKDGQWIESTTTTTTETDASGMVSTKQEVNEKILECPTIYENFEPEKVCKNSKSTIIAKNGKCNEIISTTIPTSDATGNIIEKKETQERVLNEIPLEIKEFELAIQNNKSDETIQQSKSVNVKKESTCKNGTWFETTITTTIEKDSDGNIVMVKDIEQHQLETKSTNAINNCASLNTDLGIDDLQSQIIIVKSIPESEKSATISLVEDNSSSCKMIENNLENLITHQECISDIETVDQSKEATIENVSINEQLVDNSLQDSLVISATEHSKEKPIEVTLIENVSAEKQTDESKTIIESIEESSSEESSSESGSESDSDSSSESESESE